MKNLEFKDIAGNISYGLKVLDTSSNKIFTVDDSIHIQTWLQDIFGVYKSTYENISIFQTVRDELLKPILYPVGSLYKTMTHNGKDIIPIIELAKIARKKMHFDKSDWTLKYGVACLGRSRFYYHSRECRFDLTCGYVINQYQLFDYMNELKIDYRGLIDAGLAVSVYDLKENPYKNK
jgi:hypothetical protein